jgi:hypothetical protein
MGRQSETPHDDPCIVDAEGILGLDIPGGREGPVLGPLRRPQGDDLIRGRADLPLNSDQPKGTTIGGRRCRERRTCRDRTDAYD